MKTIANGGTISKEMMGALMNNKTGMMVMQQHAVVVGHFRVTLFLFYII